MQNENPYSPLVLKQTYSASLPESQLFSGQQMATGRDWVGLSTEEVGAQGYYKYDFERKMQDVSSYIASLAAMVTQLQDSIVNFNNKLDKITPTLSVSPLTRNVPILNLRSDRLRLKMPLPIHIDHQEGQVIVSSADLDLFASGETEQEAIEEFSSLVCELYYALKEEKDKLGYYVKNISSFLLDIIEEK